MDKDLNEPGTLNLEWMEGDMPYSTAFGDHFYCRTDGRAECGHVFLAGNGLPERWHQGGTFTIGELGFGTGLNFCETWRVWKSRDAQLKSLQANLHFISFELYPMDRDSIGKAIGRWPEIAAERQALLDQWPDRPSGIVDLQMDDSVRLTVVCGEALENVRASEEMFDAWYLDGFAPSRNGAMWSPELMKAVFDHTKDDGTFATYAAAGFVRRNLVAAGFRVERRPGFAGKREMLAGTKV
ncbi:MAG: 5-methylaminomethyl-2-thiouridine methyltransferase [Rhizobium sp.]|nr:5-methylaminomethyl-2-thiouridine methyltransferase [Rhizobium sp.]